MKNNIIKELEYLEKKFQSESQNSIDYAQNAKSIAFSSNDLKEKLYKNLEDGFKISKIRPLNSFGSGVVDFKLEVELEKDGVIKSWKYILIRVDLVTRNVNTIDEYSEPITNISDAIPFAFSRPFDFSSPSIPIIDMDGKRKKIKDFIDQLNLTDLFKGKGLIADSTSTACETETRGGRKDIQTDTTCNSGSGTMTDDTKNDGYEHDYTTDAKWDDKDTEMTITPFDPRAKW